MLKTFHLGLILRVLFLVASVFLVTYLVLETTYHVSQFILGIIIVGQVYFLIRYLERTNVLLTRFLDAIEYSDFTGTFRNRSQGAGFGDLNKAFGKVIEKFRLERNKKEESIRYLETVVQHIGIGLICFNSQGEVKLLNTAAKKLFRVPVIRHLENLGEVSEKLMETVRRMKSGSRTLLRIEFQDEPVQLAMYATEFRMRDEFYKLVSFQNIQTELEEKEMEAWQNLTQVLAHEIMNSITPIASLSNTVQMLLEQNMKPVNSKTEIPAEAIQDVNEALLTISNRSKGLMRFVNSYRDFTQIPEPEYQLFSVQELLKRVVNLMKQEAAFGKITIDWEVDPESLELTADVHLIEQALINLVKNAIRAIGKEEAGQGHVLLKAGLDEEGRVVISVADNGPGITQNAANKIFIPFYSMGPKKEKQGSGIGLSLSRQIMRLHGGTLTLNTDRKKGSEFKLRF